ncbi:MAG: non-canonical purine NTP pyrophosphatase [Thermoanaerobaculia bacterium]
MEGVLRLVTSRREKAEEARRLGFAVEQEPLELPEPQSLDPSEIAAHKARAAWGLVGRPVVVEDSGLSIDAWGGFPGALVKWMEKSAGLAGMARMLDPFPDRAATARCALCFFDGSRLVEALGECPGSIAAAPRGTAGFGWDAIFIPEGHARTFAELPPSEKDAVSHRGRAWMVLGERLGLRRRAEP